MAGRGKEVREDSSREDEVCVVCFRAVEIYSVGECDHPVCYECSTRMRVLCARNECPICRKDMSKVSQYVQSILVYLCRGVYLLCLLHCRYYIMTGWSRIGESRPRGFCCVVFVLFVRMI